MIEVILLIFGIIYAVRRPRLKRLTPQDYPEADGAKFAVWQAAELSATNVFLWATWGAFLVKIGLTTIAVNGGMGEDAAGVVAIAFFVAWIVGLVVAGVLGSRAKKLRADAGIVWPKK